MRTHVERTAIGVVLAFFIPFLAEDIFLLFNSGIVSETEFFLIGLLVSARIVGGFAEAHRNPYPDL